ncbi:MAG: hypothetical protein U1E62_11125 [Alsobacter sp.]
MTGPSSPTPFGPRRLLWLVALKIVLLAFAVLVALRVYGLI